MSRLTVDLSEQQHQSLKALAALEGKTIREYAIERLFPASDDVAWSQLKSLLKTRIEDGLAGKVSTARFADIYEEELRADRDD